MKVRLVKTASGARAVQVVQYHNNTRKVLRHIGSTHSEEVLADLLLAAEEWIKDFGGQLSIFPDNNPHNILLLNHSTFMGVKYRFFYEQIMSVQDKMHLDFLLPLLRDLVAIRIFEPASKLRSLELLEQHFGIKHSRKAYYKMAPKCIELKRAVEAKVIDFAKVNYGFNYDLLFYDVTTLYFETFEEDELRKNGFSKDNKSQQPQILVALMVSKDGFPVAYEVLSGNTFEGHTLIPVIKEFIVKNEVKDFCVVADAAMISTDNVEQLLQHNINYIVGARLGNASAPLLKIIDDKMGREDGNTIRIKADNGYLICAYSSVRYRKDKYEMEKQIEKAKQLIATPSKSKKLKFTQTNGQRISLNQPLIEKTEKLLGIKGYYTNLEQAVADNATIIARYHELYRIEQAFRIAKNDLQTRPIFHFKEDPIRLHMLICFLALVIAKHIELKTGISIKRFVHESKNIVDGEILNHITNKINTIKAAPTPKMDELIAKLKLPH